MSKGKTLTTLALAGMLLLTGAMVGCGGDKRVSKKRWQDPFSKIDPRFEPGTETWWQLKRDQLRKADRHYEMTRHDRPQVAAKYSNDIFQAIRHLEQRYPDLGGGAIKETLIELRFKHEPIATRDTDQ